MNARRDDKFYTKPAIAQRCIRAVAPLLKRLGYGSDAYFIEPSAGAGAFVRALIAEMGVEEQRIISCDIDPAARAKHTLDYLSSTKKTLHITAPKETVIVIGNPPFGTKSNRAIAFVNKSLLYAQTIAFIVPLQFKKWSVQNALDDSLRLVHDEDLPENSFLFKGNDYALRACFQVWTVRTGARDLRLRVRPPLRHPDFVMYLHNNTKETEKYFDKKTYGWEFAVPRQGYYDYALRVENETHLKKNWQWMFFKPKNKTVSKRLRALDYAALSLRNTAIPGYGKADVVQEYTARYGNGA